MRTLRRVAVPGVVLVVAASLLAGGCRNVSPSGVLNYGEFATTRGDVHYAGSAFAIDEKTAVTTSHSCAGDTSTTLVTPNGLFSTRAYPGRIGFREGDITVIDLDTRHEGPWLSLSERAPEAGDPVMILDGGNGDHRFIAATMVSPDTLRIESWYDSIRKGSSGSPVLNDRGEVVGMVFGSLTVGKRRFVSIHTVSDIRHALQSSRSRLGRARPDVAN